MRFGSTASCTVPWRIRKSPTKRTRSGKSHTSTTPIAIAIAVAQPGERSIVRPALVSVGSSRRPTAGTSASKASAQSTHVQYGRKRWRLRPHAAIDGTNANAPRASTRIVSAIARTVVARVAPSAPTTSAVRTSSRTTRRSRDGEGAAAALRRFFGIVAIVDVAGLRQVDLRLPRRTARVADETLQQCRLRTPEAQQLDFLVRGNAGAEARFRDRRLEPADLVDQPVRARVFAHPHAALRDRVD